ncbi:MAG TPA: 50S ribosomal protein L35 [Actinomycetota bacterium]|nr:50S ribosomal protein L35 [Actinomycetota bacterium]
MPKMKTHRGAAKRLKRTGTGTFVRAQVGVRHYLEHKPGKLRRRLQREAVLSPGDARRARKLLGD